MFEMFDFLSTLPTDRTAAKREICDGRETEGRWERCWALGGEVFAAGQIVAVVSVRQVRRVGNRYGF